MSGMDVPVGNLSDVCLTCGIGQYLPSGVCDHCDQPRPNARRDALRQDLAAVLNKHSRENGSNTPDFILAEYLLGCLEAFESSVRRREKWYAPKSPPTIRDQTTGEVIPENLRQPIPPEALSDPAKTWPPEL